MFGGFGRSFTSVPKLLFLEMKKVKSRSEFQLFGVLILIFFFGEYQKVSFPESFKLIPPFLVR